MQLTRTAIAQDSIYIKNPAIGIHFVMDDFKTADYIRSNSLSAAFRNKQFANSKNLKPGLAVSYEQGFSNHFDFSVTIAGSYLDYNLHNGTCLGNGNLLLETAGCVIGKMFTDKHLISPYLVAGIGASMYNNYYGGFMPIGTGLQVNFSNEVYLLINSEYRIGFTNKVNDHFYYSIGLAGNILKKKNIKKLPVKSIPPVLSKSYDRDKDGIPDSVDVCPDVPGLKQFHGCPDTDGDGIPDNEDKCPTVPGFLKYKGCPVPDTDGDGINDDNDSCPTIAGLLKYHGCPIPDSDSDGINDEQDKCPLQPGTKENGGCPAISDVIQKEIAADAQRIFFSTGSYDLLPESYKALNDIAKVLLANPALKLLVEGHTDNTGTLFKNQLLSEKRSASVVDYLVLKSGISKSRLQVQGYGALKPVADNETAKGRALNRRVELKLFY